jgi:transposase
MNRNKYPSDISRRQFEMIRPLLESARKKTRPRTVDLYDVFCAVLYLLKSGCQWRMLPQGFPKWRTAHMYFQIWTEQREDTQQTTLDLVLKKIGRKMAYRKWKERQDEFLHR